MYAAASGDVDRERAEGYPGEGGVRVLVLGAAVVAGAAVAGAAVAVDWDGFVACATGSG